MTKRKSAICKTAAERNAFAAECWKEFRRMASKRRGKLRKYPRIGMAHGKPVRETGMRCDYCGSEMAKGTAFFYVDVQFDWFRGNDEVAQICRQCAGKRANLAHKLDPHKLLSSICKREEGRQT